MRIKYKSVIEKTFFSLLPMQIIMITISSINSIIDGVIASNFISATALAVIALFLPVTRILDTVSSIFLGGAQILCGQYIGRNRQDRYIAVFSTDLFILVLFGLAATACCLVFRMPIASLLGKDSKLASELAAYVLGYSFGIVPMILIPQLTAFLQLERQEKRTYVGMVSMIVLNITLDIVFVSVLDMGMFGLGLATTISNLSFLLILLSYYIFHDSALKFRFRGIRLGEVRQIVHIGFPGAVSTLGQAIRSILLNMIMLSFVGEAGISAFSAVYSFGAVYWAASGGVSTAVRVLSSIYVGEEDRTGLHTILKTALTKGTLLVCIIAGICMLCSPLFTIIFYGPGSGAVYRMTLYGFLLFPLSMPFSCICCVFSAYYQCTGRIRIVNILLFVDALFGVIAFSFLLAPALGMTGVWLAHIANGILTVLVIVLYTLCVKKRWPVSVSDLLVLRDSFGVPSGDRIDLQISDMNDVVNLSEGIVVFARQHAIDEKRSVIAGLCIEEMAGNIVKHGFDGKKNYNIDVRVVYKDNGLLIRIKDNCRCFNPKEVQSLYEPDDFTRNIGLRLVSGLADSMSYNNCLGINVLSITV